MNNRLTPDSPAPHALELFQPQPNVFYGLDEAARLAGVSRRSLLSYSRDGFIRPVFQPPYGIMEFTEEAIFTVRRIENLRAVHGLDVAWIKILFELLDEVDRLRAEIRFLRNH